METVYSKLKVRNLIIAQSDAQPQPIKRLIVLFILKAPWNISSSRNAQRDLLFVLSVILENFILLLPWSYNAFTIKLIKHISMIKKHFTEIEC